jgi:hypothetical protein
MKTKDFKNMYKVFFINAETKGRNVAFLNVGSMEEATLYCLKKFGDNFISVETYLGVKRK